jgi:hypothetical protein
MALFVSITLKTDPARMKEDYPWLAAIEKKCSGEILNINMAAAVLK